ncbi:MAG: 1-(5-phosphoribosyl)-5-[(5-phosphoribosylamino)methylideneamino]imidazole-4-carboxamide isomerase [Planctomycetes bacterium]|nr:1-(5-phosphoribosyl)-5-[(5-phosphoribosylamino)methylideneamino]imidazole-4-carboxamide isomerase [Planctomycetota bacterium]
MQILPAIDLRDGKCVRLKQGDYGQETIFGDDPAAMARRWVDQGAEILHLVDLDGAKAGHPVNGESVRRIVEACKVPCQLGGGIRVEDDVKTVLGWGVSRVIIGTRALQDPVWVREMAFKYPQKIVLGLDARDGLVATHGWLTVSTVTVLEMAQQFSKWPLAAIVFTDIARDGMMAGPNVEALAELAAAVPLPVIASGGVTTMDDVRRLLGHNLAGCIIGRALYEGTLNLTEVLKLV